MKIRPAQPLPPEIMPEAAACSVSPLKRSGFSGSIHLSGVVSRIVDLLKYHQLESRDSFIHYIRLFLV
jgi:hypothetical protein